MEGSRQIGLWIGPCVKSSEGYKGEVLLFMKSAGLWIVMSATMAFTIEER